MTTSTQSTKIKSARLSGKTLNSIKTSPNTSNEPGSQAKPRSENRQGNMRLHKILARDGSISLRAAERAITMGRVTVNGVAITQKGANADPNKDVITIDERKISGTPTRVYLILNKPKGYICSRHDEKGRKTVMDLVPDNYQNLYPVGRLDYNSEGLLLLTNDGDFTQLVLAPKNHIDRTYMVKVRNLPTVATLNKMESGITINRVKLKAGSVRMNESTDSGAWLRFVLTEGKKHQIRKLCETLGHPVQKLKRVSIGPITLGNLKPGESRHLSIEVVNRIKKDAGTTRSRK
tara:strand:+ start:104976 stop:105848 length:873 start_codon:yes stop_codon:yes gene_type:complete